MTTRPEVLAPAGDPESLRAAVRAGADAVYFGVQGHNARARATNFDIDELSTTMAFLHTHGRRGYVTLNTLVFDAELEGVEAAIRACAGAGADAVIVQDLGVARMVRSIAPTLPVHASTQMTCTDAGAIELARELGASRVILARELSIEEIAKIRSSTDVEIEVFVHGALCVAYSGQCLTSEAIGGRSANRGACAQACRLPYELVVDGEERDLGERAYLLSPEDLDASALVPRLAELGVSALKIEGRLKGPEYVAATTRLYRSAVDGAGDLGSLRATALQTFSRGSGPGFLGGVDHQRLVEGRTCDHRGIEIGSCVGVTNEGGRDLIEARLDRAVACGDGILVEGGFAGEGEVGGRIWSIVPRGGLSLLWLGPDKDVRGARRGRIFRTDDPKISIGPGFSGGARREFASGARSEPKASEVGWSGFGGPDELAEDRWKRPLAIRIEGRIGELPVLEATSGRVRVRAVGDARVERARSNVDVRLVLEDKLGRLGETPFRLDAIEVDLPHDVMIPPASLNRARRTLVEALIAASFAPHATTARGHRSMLEAARPPDRAPPEGGLFVLCRRREQALAAADAGASGVILDFLDLVGTGRTLEELRERAIPVALAPPRIRKPGEEAIDRHLLDLEPDAILVRGLGMLREQGTAVPRIGDFSLNVTNRITAAEVLSRGLAAFTPSYDLDAGQLERLLDSPFAPFAEVVIHHPMPLFHMEHCVYAALLSDGHDHTDCGRPCDRHEATLRDRAGIEHPIEADVGCRNTVFHGTPQSAATLVPAIRALGVRRWRIELLREGPEEVRKLVRVYRRLIGGEQTGRDVWQTLRADLTYGVVRGSLRIL
jgi:putative protease